MVAYSFTTYALVSEMIHKEIITKKAVFFDLDGVIWQGNQIIEGANETITELQKSMQVFFITNNSTKTRLQYQLMMSKIGIETTVEMIMTSGFAASAYLAEVNPGSRIYLIGEEGLQHELEQQGLIVINGQATDDIDYVLVGLDRFFVYSKLADALTALQNGARFLATNDDPQLPTERGLFPGAGTMISALSTCSGKTPEIIFGKPNTFMLEQSLNQLNLVVSDTVFIGDRIDTDILAAKRLNMSNILVLSGITTPDMLKTSKISPDLVLSTINDLV